MEIWKALEKKYNTERQGTDKFLMMKYFEFKMLDSVPIMDQVHELQILVSGLHDLKVIILESLQVGAIISKLLSSWNDYRKKLLPMAEDFTVEKILRHLSIEEETRKRDAVYLPKGSKVNHVSESQNSRKGKRNAMSNTEDTQDKKRKSRNCYHFNKKGHYIKDCKLLKKEKDAATSKVNMVEDMDLVAMVTRGIESLEIDDLLIFGMDLEGVCETKEYLASNFKMKDLNEIDTILGIKVQKHERGFALSQSHFIEKVLEKFKCLNIKDSNTPFDLNFKLSENTGRAIAQLEYASAIESLMYAMHCTRPDIAFAVCKLARFTSCPSTDHWKGICRILGYLRKTKNLGLFYGDYPVVLEGYSDAS
ncbi:hypothetical protein CRG98_034653 [Punica granatum]|uniref:Reverse transcriptase Ty1/copia-type domain-containing protein n=1 Tax=Punica granatum TaxID=22663 RepID=A0A2I0ILR8_PUNGR|nr:hypothetical protein CRG98_034653 [Punica granatum]